MVRTNSQAQNGVNFDFKKYNLTLKVKINEPQKP